MTSLAIDMCMWPDASSRRCRLSDLKALAACPKVFEGVFDTSGLIQSLAECYYTGKEQQKQKCAFFLIAALQA